VEVSVDLRTPDAAFLDHYFLGRHTNGTLLTQELRLRGDARILGMSSDAAANASMVGAGANLALRKAELMRLLGI
jgi:hypothetical protein